MISRTAIKILILLCGLLAGWGSAYYAIDAFGSTKMGGKSDWRKWDLAAVPTSNPYALAHFLLGGQVPPAQSLFQVFTTNRDDDGKALNAECTYMVSADDFDARWWALSIEPANTAENSSTSVATANEVLRSGDGSFGIAVSRFPISGNWVRPTTTGEMTLRLVVSNDNASQDQAVLTLPTVQKLGC
jgi:hypothetical protein